MMHLTATGSGKPAVSELILSDRHALAGKPIALVTDTGHHITLACSVFDGLRGTHADGRWFWFELTRSVRGHRGRGWPVARAMPGTSRRPASALRSWSACASWPGHGPHRRSRH
jgi:hypothetical protein